MLIWRVGAYDEKIGARLQFAVTGPGGQHGDISSMYFHLISILPT
jgi:hypothetical protein